MLKVMANLALNLTRYVGTSRLVARRLALRYVSESGMKILLSACLLAVSTSTLGGEYGLPIHSPEEVVRAVLESGSLNREEVKVVLLKYDYLKNEWHVELMPSNKSCIDCYPSYHIENTESLNVRAIPHG
jgi:hypothetical protein